MTSVFRRSDSNSKTYYFKHDGRRIKLHENKHVAEQMAADYIAKAQRAKYGIEAPLSTKKEPKALQVISEYLATRGHKFQPNTLKIIHTNTVALFGSENRQGYFGNIPLSSISDNDIHKLVKTSLETLKYATVKQRVKYMRFFGRWAIELGHIRVDQMPGKLGTRRYMPKEHKLEKQVPTRAEFDLVFSKLHKRFQPYVMTLLCTGCRRMELAQAKVSWIKETNGRLFLSLPSWATKTRAARTTPILPEAVEYVRKQMKGKGPDDFLFESNPELLAVKAGQNVRYWVRKLGIQNRFVLHTLRAMFIVELNVRGIPISQIALWSGQTIQQCFEYCKINKCDSEALLTKAGL